jgi:hypothetical protein
MYRIARTWVRFELVSWNACVRGWLRVAAVPNLRESRQLRIEAHRRSRVCKRQSDWDPGWEYLRRGLSGSHITEQFVHGSLVTQFLKALSCRRSLERNRQKTSALPLTLTEELRGFSTWGVSPPTRKYGEDELGITARSDS